MLLQLIICLCFKFNAKILHGAWNVIEILRGITHGENMGAKRSDAPFKG